MRNPRTDAGASDRLAGHVEDPTRNTPATQSNPVDAIDIFCPGASDDERSLRRRIHRAQGASTSAATRSTRWRARGYFWSAAQLAADWQFQPASIADLKDVINALSGLFMSARIVERVEAPDDAG